ncbi:hypothetical protein F5Y08DRAFT_219835 [Xylaria arbuscula]|nr:hypothetical protein F5Y08DRAFT_219835 [Xylaria arbuscula]
MTHLVGDFFDSIHSIKQTVQRHTAPAKRAGSSERHRPSRTSSYGSSHNGVVEDHSPAPSVKQPESKPKEHHRISLAHLPLVGHKSQKDLSQNPSASLDFKIESGAAVMYGSPEESTGALVSGQLQLRVKDETFEVENLDAKLEIRVTQKKPFKDHCQHCATQKTELKSWSFLAEPTALGKRTHDFPFSVLLEGHLPATTDNHLLSIEYVFTAEARPRDGGLPLKLRRVIDVRRSLPAPTVPHHSVRIFPPTDITANVHYDPVIYPNATSRFNLRLDGIGKHNVSSVEYWKLKRLSWKLEEDITTVAPACQKHTPKTASAEGSEAKKGITRSDTRVIAHADLHSGWKADYRSADGTVEAEVEYQTGGFPSRTASCDVRGHDGTQVSHRLVVEMVVSQEYAPLAHMRHVTPTGVARILRMNFAVVITDRAGLGVSWDNEAPPIYQDVPPSPPPYPLELLHDDIVEGLNLSSASSTYTEDTEESYDSHITRPDLDAPIDSRRI